MVFAELIGRDEQNQKLLDMAEDIRKKTQMVSVADAVLLEEPWKRRLKALLSITAHSETPAQKTMSNCRMIWLVDYHGGTITITAREQRVSLDKWSKGRPIALSRLLLHSVPLQAIRHPPLKRSCCQQDQAHQHQIH